MTADQTTVGVGTFRDSRDVVYRFELPAGATVPVGIADVDGVQLFDPGRSGSLSLRHAGWIVTVRCPGYDLMPARVVADMLGDAGFEVRDERLK